MKNKPIPLFLIWLGLVLVWNGSADAAETPPARPPFNFETDTFAYTNQTVWSYEADPRTGKMAHHTNKPKPTYTQHCFVMSRGAQRVFQNARFDPTLRKLNPPELRSLLQKVVHDPRPSEPLVIPGYANLREFSEAEEILTKEVCGGSWRCYLQRGNWRTIFPFSRNHQARTAAQLRVVLDRGGLAVVHLVRFPKLTINHAVAVHHYEQDSGGVRFIAYDPNDPHHPLNVTFDEATRTFRMPPSFYFAGGRVDVYQIYHKVLY